MLITKQNLDELKKFEARTVQINKEAFKLNIAKPQKNLAQICGRTLSTKFFSRQTKWFDDFTRRNILARFFDITASIYFSNPKRGEIYLQFVESFFAYLRSAAEEKAWVKGDFWQVEEEITHLSSVRRRAVASGDKQTAREITTAIERKNQIIPQFLKRAVGRRTRRKLAGKSAKRKVQINA